MQKQSAGVGKTTPTSSKPPRSKSAQAAAQSDKRQEVRSLNYEDGQMALSPSPSASPKPVGELGGALIVNRDPTYTTKGLLAWFADQIVAKATAWGLAFDRKAVRLAKDPSGATVVALDWPAGLGSAPVTREMPDFRLTPIDARLALAAVPALPGWGKVPAADQSKLTDLVGGETNNVSAATRDHLRPKYLDLRTKPEAEQAAALSATIGHRDATPSLASEAVETDPVKVTLAGPTEVKDHEFRGAKVDAHVFTATYGDGPSLRIVAPKAPDPKFHQHTVEQVAQATSYLPKKLRELLKEVQLNPVENPEDAYWAAQYQMPGFHSYMTAGGEGVVTIYPNASAPQPGETAMRGTLIHESGHTWSYRTWGTDKTKGKWLDWKRAMDSDRVSVSNYARADIAEDVAETIQIHGSTRGKPKHDEYRRLVPARFAILDKEIGA